MNGHYSQGDIVLGNWTLTKLLGQGSFGRVFEAQREDFGTIYKAAIKIISIPFNDSEIASARAEGMNDDTVCTYFRSVVEDVVNEFELMSRLKGTTNIVSYEDHVVVPHNDGIGWDVIIRMELLTPMLDHMSKHNMTRADIIKLGIDMCKALELCQRYNIIHRDIKPENIFVSAIGDYKLGDFGIARTIDKTSGGLSKKGTYTYMAPEVYKEDSYGSSVDIYSLGIVMYRLLNYNRAPFLPLPPAPITHIDRETAIMRRIGGENLPIPANAEGRLAEIVLKACAYSPLDRYSSPLMMRQELENILYDRAEDLIVNRRQNPIQVSKTAFQTAQSVSVPEQSELTVASDEVTIVQNDESAKHNHDAPPKRSVRKIIVASLCTVLLAIGAVAFSCQKSNDESSHNDEIKALSESETTSSITEPPVTTHPTIATIPTETTVATEETMPNLYPDMTTDDEGFVVVNNKGASSDKLCVLGYKVSDGSIINNPTVSIVGQMSRVRFSWKEKSDVTSTMIAGYKGKSYSESDIDSASEDMLTIWKQEGVMSSAVTESSVDTSFPMVPSQDCYVLFLSLDKDMNVVKQTVIKIGYPTSD